MYQCGIPKFVNSDSTVTSWERQWNPDSVYVKIHYYPPWYTLTNNMLVQVSFPTANLPLTLRKLDRTYPSANLLSHDVYQRDRSLITDPDIELPLNTLSDESCLHADVWRGDVKEDVEAPKMTFTFTLKKGDAKWTKQLPLAEADVRLDTILPLLTGHPFGDLKAYLIYLPETLFGHTTVYIDPSIGEYKTKYSANQISGADSLFIQAVSQNYSLTLVLVTPGDSLPIGTTTPPPSGKPSGKPTSDKTTDAPRTTTTAVDETEEGISSLKILIFGAISVVLLLLALTLRE